MIYDLYIYIYILMSYFELVCILLTLNTEDRKSQGLK